MVVENQKIDVLGTQYTIKFMDFKDYPEFQNKGACGFCDSMLKEIIVCTVTSHPEYAGVNEEYSIRFSKEILRHEILHAFLFESGLGADSCVPDCG